MKKRGPAATATTLFSLCLCAAILAMASAPPVFSAEPVAEPSPVPSAAPSPAPLSAAATTAAAANAAAANAASPTNDVDTDKICKNLQIETGPYFEKLENDLPRVSFYCLKHEAHGTFQSWHPNGNKKVEGEYDHGAIAGRWLRWYLNGHPKDEGRWENGRPEGEWTFWYENGVPRERGHMRGGKRDGVWRRWYDSGLLREQVTYDSGEEKGPARRWANNGDLEGAPAYAGSAPAGAAPNADPASSASSSVLSRFRLGLFQLEGIAGFQSGGYMLTGAVGWGPTFRLVGDLHLKGLLGLTAYRGQTSASLIISVQSLLLLAYRLPIAQLEIEAGGGLDTWLNHSSYGRLDATLGRRFPEKFLGFIDRIFVGYSALFLPAATGNLVYLGVGIPTS